jgi:ATP adenylyltransferase
MKRLYAPWRNNYTKKIASPSKDDPSEDACVFCRQLKENKDTDYFILKRFKHTVVMLNLYPYNAGHLLLLPLDHCPDFTTMSPEARCEMMELIMVSTQILQETLKAPGINVGLNLGKAAGAGIPSHLHMHVIPRWPGDTNFLPLIADTKQVSVDLHKMYAQLLPAFEKIKDLNEKQ